MERRTPFFILSDMVEYFIYTLQHENLYGSKWKALMLRVRKAGTRILWILSELHDNISMRILDESMT